MLKIIIYIFTFILCAIGLCDILHSVWMLLIKPQVKSNSLFLIFLNGEDDYSVLFEAYEKMKWYGNRFCNQAVAVYCEECDPFVQDFFEEKGIIFKHINSLDVGVLNEYRVKGNCE